MAHTRTGDELAAARRHLPMTRMEPTMVVGPNGSVPLHEVFEGLRMLIVYHFMWNPGAPHERQCEGCTHTQAAMNSDVRTFLAERDVNYAVFSSGPWAEIADYRDFMGWTTPWYSTADSPNVLETRNGGDLRCYLSDGEDVFLTPETKWRGIEAMLPTLQLLDAPFGNFPLDGVCTAVKGGESARAFPPCGCPITLGVRRMGGLRFGLTKRC